jgi:phage/plasmid primase-like uncharacterized protein
MSELARFTEQQIADAKTGTEKFLRVRGHQLKRNGGYLIGPCPVCGGTDRFNIKLRTGKWYCRGCKDGGNAIDLVMQIERLSFVEAVKHLGGANGITFQKRHPEQPTNGRQADDWLRWWREAVSIAGTLAERYLRNRGITELPSEDCLRFHSRMVLGSDRVPCLLGLVRDAISNTPIGLQRIGLTADGQKIERMALGKIGGGVVKLHGDAEVTTGLVLAEGIETALAVALMKYRGTLLQPVWSTLNAGNLERFPLLTGIEVLTIIADNDDSRRGQEAAARCAERWCAAGREVIRLTPEGLL